VTIKNLTRNLLVEQALEELSDAEVLPRLNIEARDFAWEDDYEKPYKRNQSCRKLVSVNILICIFMLIAVSFIVEDTPMKHSSFNKEEDNRAPFFKVLSDLFYHIVVFTEFMLNFVIRKTITMYNILQTIGSLISASVGYIWKLFLSCISLLVSWGLSFQSLVI